VHHVQAGTSFRGEVEFQRWRSSALAAIEQRDARLLESSPDAAQLTLVAPATGQPLLDAPTERIPAAFAEPVADAEAAARWTPALDEVLPTVGPLDRYGLEIAVPIGWRGPSAAGGEASAELTVWVHAEDVVATRSLTRSVARLEAVLAQQTGAPVRVTLAHRITTG
jgi:hypothetical protein